MDINKGLEKLKNNFLTFEEKITESQDKFMKTNIAKILNNVLDTGIKIALPNVADDAVISVKNSLLENGIKNGVKDIWNNIKNYGKSVLGLVSGKFENIEQVQMATKNGGILDDFSDIFDFSLDKSVNSGKISKSERRSLISTKNSMIKDIKSDISEELNNQVKYIKKIEEYNKKWLECYNNKDLKGMKNANKNIKKYLEKSLPLENTLKPARKIEIIQNLVESTGSFDITEEEQELAKVLAQ